jgi:hypothetical protein
VKIGIIIVVIFVLLGYSSNYYQVIRFSYFDIESARHGTPDTKMHVNWSVPFVVTYGIEYNGVAVMPPQTAIFLYGVTVYEFRSTKAIRGTNW